MRATSLLTATLLLGACVLLTSEASAGGGRLPSGVGANIHRNFMIKRAQRGQSTRKHSGIWLRGGYPGKLSSSSTKRRSTTTYRKAVPTNVHRTQPATQLQAPPVPAKSTPVPTTETAPQPPAKSPRLVVPPPPLPGKP